jgi:acetyl-CoA/propionyl-CoA carboxylase
LNEEHFIRGELSTDYLERYAIMDKLLNDTKGMSSRAQVPALAALLLYSEFIKTPSAKRGDGAASEHLPAWIRQRRDF